MRKLFEEARARWESETVFLSDPDVIADHPDYKWMVANVEQITPLIIEELRKEPSWLIMVLGDGFPDERPFGKESAGNLHAMTAAWIAWSDNRKENPKKEQTSMTTSQKMSLTNVLSADEALPLTHRAYFRGRTLNRIHEVVLNLFLEQKKQGLTQARLARKLNKRPEQVHRMLTAPGNWTLATMSDLLLAMGSELEPATSDILNKDSSKVAITVQATWDDEAKVWCASTDDVAGLAINADTLEALQPKVIAALQDMIELNPFNSNLREIPVRLIVERASVPNAHHTP